MNSAKIGLLPFYLELYDKIFPPEIIQESKAFIETINSEFLKRNIQVTTSEPCRKRKEFLAAISLFEQENVDAIVTLHLAYSPSLESIDALSNTKLPIIVLDTTPDFHFGPEQVEKRLTFNHGIHGVQDFCNLLLRHKRNFSIEVGHWQKSDVLDRTVASVLGAKAAKAFRKSRAGIVGSPFSGMGDFAVPFEMLKDRFGIEVVSSSPEKLVDLMPSPDSSETEKELASLIKLFHSSNLSKNDLLESVCAGLAVRRWMESEKLTALTMNFLEFHGSPGLPVVPFLEASLSMSRGIGYGGEGDVLTAALCGALMQAYPDSTFTEMFCPDWENELLFLSHMGEVNSSCLCDPKLVKKPYPFSSAADPALVSGTLKQGEAIFVDIAPGPDNIFTLITAKVELCSMQDAASAKKDIRGWMRPAMPIADFLERYSLLGGTHHAVLCYNADERSFATFARELGIQYKKIN